VGFGRGPRYITAMHMLLEYLVGIAMAAVLIVLLVGVFAMFKGGEFNRKYANKLMRLRVLLQAVALVLFAIFMMFFHNRS
jgi:amino acid transporter